MPRFSPGDTTRTINFRLPVEVFTRLEKVARDDDRSMNSMAVRLLNEALDARVEKAKRKRAAAAAA
jgi:hypothetical protein